MAKARIDFFIPVVDKRLLQKCMDGEEEALCDMRHFSLNNGWWDKANRLNIQSMGHPPTKSSQKATINEDIMIDFIMQKRELVHPNVIKMVMNRSNEGIRMALNQIHYGTIKTSREVKNQHLLSKNKKHNLEAFNSNHKVIELEKDKAVVSDNSKKNWRIERDFIKQQAHLVDDWILLEALNGVDLFINRALFQIHSRSLEKDMVKVHEVEKDLNNGSYKEALLK